jgi:hypothetical protein
MAGVLEIALVGEIAWHGVARILRHGSDGSAGGPGPLDGGGSASPRTGQHFKELMGQFFAAKTWYMSAAPFARHFSIVREIGEQSSKSRCDFLGTDFVKH